MSRLHGGSHRRRGVAVAIAVALLFGSAPATQGATDAGQFSYWRTGLAPLVGSHTWILQGQKLAGGGCQYSYPDQEAAIPAGGWTLRSIAIDMTSCRKLMEEGTPASPLARDPAMPPLQSKGLDAVIGSGGPEASASSTKGA
jgi:hypothetical protein